ncbi:hypothetical protein ACFFX1_55270 [Dactylosporangium sucinum]|uniref:Uncharacterized protein n=1 Tax=Dactylosporangium sucinum TaxID=1424081 RepID=A0A917U2F4_9ACTN|nr:hypothetical protein [Dactylosporangium sucinum]GGM52906.1 hypothetical protein GCM10007977_063100 [Dactylosporangium sucinum]
MTHDVADPYELARRIKDTADELAQVLATDVRIDPARVIVPLMVALAFLRAGTDELALASMSVDEEAAAAARRAGQALQEAQEELGIVLTRLPQDEAGGV